MRPVDPKATAKSDWRELFGGIYLKRTLMIWVLWLCVYMINNGMVTWLPTLYKQVFELPLQTSLAYGWTTSAVGVAASVACALLIDKVGRKRWYAAAFLLAVVPLVTLMLLGAASAVQVLVGATTAYAILQTIAFSLYLYSAELYPTRLRAIGTGFGSAWLRAGSSIGPLLVGFIVADVGIQYVFARVRPRRPRRRRHHHGIRYRNQRQSPRRTLTLTPTRPTHRWLCHGARNGPQQTGGRFHAYQFGCAEALVDSSPLDSKGPAAAMIDARSLVSQDNGAQHHPGQRRSPLFQYPSADGLR